MEDVQAYDRLLAQMVEWGDVLTVAYLRYFTHYWVTRNYLDGLNSLPFFKRAPQRVDMLLRADTLAQHALEGMGVQPSAVCHETYMPWSAYKKSWFKYGCWWD